MFYRTQGRKLGSCLFFFSFWNWLCGYFPLTCVSYDERLRELGLFSIQKRWLMSQCISVSKGEMPRLWSQALLSGAEQEDKRQWTETGAEEVPPELFLLCRWLSSETDCWEKLWRLPQGRYSSLDTTLPCALGAWAGRLDQVTHCCPFQP